MEILNIEEIVVVRVKGLVMLKLVNNDLFRYLIIVLIIGNMYLRSIGFFFVYERNRLRVLVFNELLEKVISLCRFDVF